MSLLSKVKVRVHVAYFTEDPNGKVPYFFINIRNGFKERHIKVVKIEFLEIYTVSGNVTKYVAKRIDGYGQRPLPVTISPQSEWETFVKTIAIDETSGSNDVLVTLDNGRRITSKKRKHVPPSGVVPGGSL